MADINFVKVGGRMHSTSEDSNPANNHVTSGANEIYDDAKGKKQNVINQETDEALADRYTKDQTYNKAELNNMITTPNQQYVTVATYSALPASGSADTVYRVSNWDGTQVDETCYSEYAWNGSAYVHLSTKTKIGEVFDISAYHATGGTLATYADLSAALDSNNGGGVPQSLQEGGMSVKYVRSSDNKYVQYRLTKDEWSTDVADWQGVDDEIKANDNLVTGKGIKAGTLEEKEYSYSEENVAGYITDKKGAIIGKLMKSGAVEWTVKNSRDIQISNAINAEKNRAEGAEQTLQNNIDAEKTRAEGAEQELSNNLEQNYLKEYTIDIEDGNIVGYITDKNKVIIAYITKDGAIERTVQNSKDILLNNIITNIAIQAEKINELSENTLKEIVIEDTEENVAAYITGKNGVIIGKINKDGSINRLVENDRDRHTVHFEDVDIDGIVNLLVDKKNNVISSINDNGEVDFYGGGGFAGEKTTEAKTGEYIRLLVSKNKVVVGGVKKDGTVHLFKAKIDNLDTEVDINITALINALPIITSGLNNVEISNDQRIMNLLTSVNSTKVIDIKGVDIKNKLKPIMSIIDDDTVDGQIPSSMGKSVPDNTGGYFSVLLPIILSLNDKYGINAKVGLACEGHRVGLTTFYQPNDDYSQLNENGNLLKLLSNKIGWDILNHSMSAQLPVNTYGVDSINSALADQILAEGTYSSPLNFYNTIVLDKSTGKWYEVNSTKTAWVERVPTKKYAMQYYRDYGTNNYHINRDFDFDYSWGEWYRRAKELGLPYKSCIVYNGSTTSPFTITASRKYAEFGIRTTLDRANVPPIPAAVARYTIAQSSDSNAEVEATTEKMKRLVDECYSKHSWLVWMSHAHNDSLRNKYNTGVDYGSKKDDNYSSEWEIPLNASEITTMDTNNYWVNPPARLGISRWKDWHPAPGTQIGAFYEVLEYAINKGINIVTPTDGWKTHGNLMQIGIDMMGTGAANPNIVDSYTDEEQSFLTVGADGSIRYFSK